MAVLPKDRRETEQRSNRVARNTPSAWLLASAVASVVFCATVAMRARVLLTQDLYLHITVGRWIAEHRQVPVHGVFSGSMPDAPWLAHEWLSSLIFAGLYDQLGWNGVVAAAALVMALAVAIVAYEIGRAAGPVAALVCALLAWGLCQGHLQARPHLLTLPLFALWIAAHVRAREHDRAPPLYLALLMILWANLHGGFLIAPVFTLLFAGEVLYLAPDARRTVAAAWRWGVFFVASVAGALITPHGFAGLLFPIRLTNMTLALAGIVEWEPSSLANNPPLIIWLLLVLFFALLLGLRVAVTRIAMVLILIYMAFAHFRFAELLGLGAPLLMREALANTKAISIGAVPPWWGRTVRPRVAAAALAVMAAAVAASLLLVARNPGHDSDRFTPTAAVDWALARHLDGPVMNAFNFGGYLIFRGVAPFIDARVELYGQDFVLRDFAPDQLPALLDQYRIAWTIFYPRDEQTAILDRMPEWRRVYDDGQAVIHVRR
jgi:MFS family permease